MRVDAGTSSTSASAATAPSRATLQAAKDLENVFLQQLTTELAKLAQPADDGSSDSTDSGDDSTSAASDPATSLYTQMLPDAMAQSLSAAGGIGLAAQLAKTIGAQQ